MPGAPPGRALRCCIFFPPLPDRGGGGPSCERGRRVGWARGSLGSLGACVAVRAAPARGGGWPGPPSSSLCLGRAPAGPRAVSLWWGPSSLARVSRGPRAELHNRFYTFLPPAPRAHWPSGPPTPRLPQHCERGCPCLSASAVLTFNKAFCNGPGLSSCPPTPTQERETEQGLYSGAFIMGGGYTAHGVGGEQECGVLTHS